MENINNAVDELKKRLLYESIPESELEEGLAGRENIVGVGIGLEKVKDDYSDEVCLVVDVRKKLPKDKIAKRFFVEPIFNGCKTSVEEAEEAELMSSRIQCNNPAMGGMSISNWDKVTGVGTFGCVVRTRVPGENKRYILSNNHVLSNNEDLNPDKNNIVQPGDGDGGQHEPPSGNPPTTTHPGNDCLPGIPDKCIAFLSAFKKILKDETVNSSARPLDLPFNPGSNIMDAAIAEIHEDRRDVVSQIVDVARAPRTPAHANLRDSVKKSGRTTAVTHGRIIRTNYDFILKMAESVTTVAGVIETTQWWSWWEDQIVVKSNSGAFVKKGDSGSVILNASNNVVGLLFSGSVNGKYGFVNPIKPILRQFNVEIVPG